MEFIVTGNTDIGLTKSTNQDSLLVKVVNTKLGRMVLAVLCDGMGGLAKGEVASASVINAFDSWLNTGLRKLCESAAIKDADIRAEWEQIIKQQNERIQKYGAGLGIHLGTTVTAMLLTQNRYYILNVGDTRAYEIKDGVYQITKDQTFVAREIAQGRMTEEQARVDDRRNVLLQCVGASEEVYPDMFFGDVKKDAVYMLCCDGFRHEITNDEIYQLFSPAYLVDSNSMYNNANYLIELNKQRRERDNITVALIRTY